MGTHTHDRRELGSVDLDQEEFDALVRTALGAPVEVLSSTARTVDYALEAMTTGGRWWVEGEARFADGRTTTYRFFVKLARSVRQSPVWQLVPESHRPKMLEVARWDLEPTAYRSRLRDVLPPGIRMPHCHSVTEPQPESAVLWLEAVEPDPAPWTVERYEEAARHLGRFAASPEVAAVTEKCGHPLGSQAVRTRWEGQFAVVHVTAYADDSFWQHPALARVTHLRPLLARLIEAVPDLIAEIEELPLVNGHGDACPQNLLFTLDGDLVMIDWAFWSRARLAHDLNQLVMSELDLGRMTADRIPSLREAAVRGYHRGLADGGLDLSLDLVDRAWALQSAAVSGVGVLPMEALFGPPTPGLEQLIQERAAVLPHLLDAVGIGRTRS